MTSDQFWGSLNRQPDGCWVWTGARSAKGYGQVGVIDGAKINRQTHRVAYELAKGRIGPGLMVCHKCDNRACCNPDHLFLGSAQDNVHDKMAKMRERAGIPRVCANGHVLTPSNCLRCTHELHACEIAQDAVSAPTEAPAAKKVA